LFSSFVPRILWSNFGYQECYEISEIDITRWKNSRKCTVFKLNSSNKPSQAAYKILINKKCTRPEKSQKKWIRDCELVNVENLDWESIYLLPRIRTLSTKLRNFQFKFLHRRIATNSFLLKIKFSESNLCCLRQTAQERLLHLFWESPITEAFWNSVQQFHLCWFNTSLTSFNFMPMFRSQRREKRLLIQLLFTTW